MHECGDEVLENMQLQTALRSVTVLYRRMLIKYLAFITSWDGSTEQTGVMEQDAVWVHLLLIRVELEPGPGGWRSDGGSSAWC